MYHISPDVTRSPPPNALRSMPQVYHNRGIRTGHELGGRQFDLSRVTAQALHFQDLLERSAVLSVDEMGEGNMHAA